MSRGMEQDYEIVGRWSERTYESWDRSGVSGISQGVQLGRNVEETGGRRPISVPTVALSVEAEGGSTLIKELPWSNEE
jgi:hypothetical protein